LKHFKHANTKEPVLDFLGTGGQAVAPPSLHPSGEVREWVGGSPGEPTVLPFQELWDAVNRLALACGCKLPSISSPAPAASPTKTPHGNILKRAIAYLDTIPSAVSGHGGHSGTYWPARVLCWGFDLGEDVAFDILKVHFNPRCEPPWTDNELRH